MKSVSVKCYCLHLTLKGEESHLSLGFPKKQSLCATVLVGIVAPKETRVKEKENEAEEERE